MRVAAVARVPVQRGLRHMATMVDARTDIDYSSLTFSYTPVRSHMRFTWKDGKWDDGELVNEPYQKVHILSGALHYGQTIFEGLKAFRGHDNKIRVFNSSANAARLQRGSERFLMPHVPTEMFNDAVDAVVRDNADYVPPVETGGSMYLRPNLFGCGPKLGLGPAPEYTLNISCAPVGPYYVGGVEPVDALVVNGYDRAAPMGVGSIKCGGNYAADLRPAAHVKDAGYSVALYLDAATRSYVEEFSTSNFVGITKDQTYVTPKSDSILGSITNQVLQTLAKDAGMKVEARPVHWDEVSQLREAGACGTAVVITPLKSVTRNAEDGSGASQVIKFDGHATLLDLYTKVQQLQRGEIEDKWGYTRTI